MLDQQKYDAGEEPPRIEKGVEVQTIVIVVSTNTIPQVLLNANLCSAAEDFYRDGPNEFCYSSMSTLDSSEDSFDDLFNNEELVAKLSQIETAYQIGHSSCPCNTVMHSFVLS